MKWLWSKQPKPTWPALPSSRFIRGRSAAVADLDKGDAVFCQQSDEGRSASAWPVEIPQYAFWHNERGELVPSVLVQAEAHISDPSGEPLFGLRGIDGSEFVATGLEVTLLGAKLPS